MIAHEQADRIGAALGEADVGCRPYYRTPVHLQPPMREWAPVRELPGTAEAARTHLAIPMSPVLSREQADQVLAAIADALGGDRR